MLLSKLPVSKYRNVMSAANVSKSVKGAFVVVLGISGLKDGKM